MGSRLAGGDEPLISLLSSVIYGVLALLLVWLSVGSALAALLLAAPELDPVRLWHDAYLRRVLWFTCWQALLSTLLSVGLALPVVRALARRQHFFCRGLLLKLFSLPLIMPTIVAVFGVVAVYGQSGWLNQLAALVNLPPGQYLYGLPGILIAHVFFNLPLAIRLLLPLWRQVPDESWRLAAQLGMGSGAIFRLIEWPLLRQALPGVAGLIFMLCFTSFAVVLTLGGGPRATTVEVAIYQALRLDFDLGRAVLLALLQLGFCALLIVLGQLVARPLAIEATPGRGFAIPIRPDLAGRFGKLADAVWIVLAALFVLLPLAAVILAGAAGPLLPVLADGVLWRAAGRSLLVALSAGTLALAGGWALLALSQRLRRITVAASAVELSGLVILVVPPLVLGTGFFVLLAPLVNVFNISLLLVIVVNALMGLPYVIRLLGPALAQTAARHDRLCASLGIRGWQRLKLIEWPLARPPAGLALALCAALATGDLGVIALFGTQDTTTLPLLLYQRLAGYQMGQAAVTALVLLTLALGLFIVIERAVGGRRKGLRHA